MKPRIDMDFTETQLFHYVFERGHAGCDMFWLVREGFEESGCILFTVEADYECLER